MNGTVEQATVAREQVRTTVPSIPAPSGQLGMMLHSMEDYWRFAECVLKAGWAPDGMNQQGIVVAMQFGAELGIDPVQSVQNIAVINGKPTVWGDMLLGLCMRKTAIFDQSVFEEGFTGQGDTLEAHCVVGRIGGKPRRETFSVEDAKRAKVHTKNGIVSLWSKATYQSYPRHMLLRRARSFALRYTFPDVTKGLYSTEEMTVDDVLGGLDLTGQAPAAPFDPEKVSKPAPVPPPPPANETTMQGGPPPTEEPAPTEAIDTCPECGGRKHGRGFQHADRCSKSRTKAEPETPPVTPDAHGGIAPAEKAQLGMMRGAIIRDWERLAMPDQEQLKHEWGWPNPQGCFDPKETIHTLKTKHDQITGRLETVKPK